MKHKRSAEATRKRLTATSRKNRPPTASPAVSDTVNRQDRVLVTPMRNRHSNAGIIQAPNTALIAPSGQTFSPDLRTPQSNPSSVELENTALSGPTNPKLKISGEPATAKESAPANSNYQTSPAANIPAYHGRSLTELK
ncbi:hypothetical protein N7524_011860 [Penicillium chrysogenum]|nr:hypothetical protein N7524_011860 [Penicillium chrysogenum]